METSLRYSGDSKALRIHAKEKFSLDTKNSLQVHGELDTAIGAPSYISVLLRHFYPNLSATLGVGLQHDKQEKFQYIIHGKKSFPITNNGLVNFNIKGRCYADKDFVEMKSRGAAELSFCIFNVQKDQDVRVRVGYEVFNKVPYLQIRENNWTVNADISGRWNVRFDL